ncbi:MAG: glucan 1,4-alpha-glucosidase, partial [Caulobacteraceae bacterium]
MKGGRCAGLAAALGCGSLLSFPALSQATTAPGAPGSTGTWAYAGKSGIGTAYAPYGPGRAASRVWFSLAHGVLTETMYGLIHQAQLRELQFAVRGPGFLAFENGGVVTRQSFLATDAAGRPTSLAYRIVNTDKAGRFEIEKHVFTDPDSDSLFMRVIVRAKSAAVTPILLADPQMAGSSQGDRAEGDIHGLHAWKGDVHMVIKAAQPYIAASVGFVGASDGETELRRSGRIGHYETTGSALGNVAVAAELAPTPAGGERVYDIVIGFGHDKASAQASAASTLRRGYAPVLAAYNGGAGHVGWADYLQGLSELPRVAAMAGDGGRLAYSSAMVLKAQEDKTHPGALIASLSTPW